MKIVFFSALVLHVSWTLYAADWPCFRGPNRTGVSTETRLPLEWSDSRNIAWKRELPGPGASSPITFSNNIYVTSYSGYGVDQETPGQLANLKRHLICLDIMTGKVRWEKIQASKQSEDPWGSFLKKHGYASSTPAADATGVYVFYGTSGVVAYNHDGTLRWEQNCGKRHENFGSGSSPVLYGNMVIINAEREGGALLALDKATGREIWRVATDANARSTPLLVPLRGSTELVFHLKGSHDNGSGKGILAAVNPDTGTMLWQCQALDSYLHPSPISFEGIVYAVASYPGWATAIKAGGKGDVTATHKQWQIKKGSCVCTPVYHNGYLYWTSEERGIAYCADAATGKLMYEERLQPTAGLIYASAIIGDGKLYYVSREKGTFVLAAKPEFELLAHNVLGDGSIFNATPAISRGRVLLRSDRYLYCIAAAN